MGLTAPQASVIGSAVSGGAGVASSFLNAKLQKDLLHNQYNEFIRQSQKVGATPSAIAQGLTNSGASSTPSVNSTPMPDLGSNISSAMAVQSENKRRDVLSDIDLAKLPWELGKFNSDMKEAASRIALNNVQGGLFKAQRGYYNELAKDLSILRPWKVGTFISDLETARFLRYKMTAETDTIRKQGNYYDAAGRFQDAAAYDSWNSGYNKSLEAFGIQFNNALMSQGINPNQPYWENLRRLAATDPALFNKQMDALISSLHIVDDKAKSYLGERYKRNILLGVGAYKAFVGLRSGAQRFGQTALSLLPIARSAIPVDRPVVTGFGRY